MSATITPSNATNKEVTWTSNDNSIATVNNGQVAALKPGTVTITATVDGKKATSTITITNNITYDYEIVDIAGSTTGQCYIYIRSSEGKHVSGSLTVTYKNGASETLNVPASGYMWPSRSVIASISNVTSS